ncbi:hypothetical protein Dimus_016454 [Dionaea muscipula]
MLGFEEGGTQAPTSAVRRMASEAREGPRQWVAGHGGRGIAMADPPCDDSKVVSMMKVSCPPPSSSNAQICGVLEQHWLADEELGAEVAGAAKLPTIMEEEKAYGLQLLLLTMSVMAARKTKLRGVGGSSIGCRQVWQGRGTSGCCRGDEWTEVRRHTRNTIFPIEERRPCRQTPVLGKDVMLADEDISRSSPLVRTMLMRQVMEIASWVASSAETDIEADLGDMRRGTTILFGCSMKIPDVPSSTDDVCSPSADDASFPSIDKVKG